MADKFRCYGKNGDVEVAWIVKRFHLGKFKKSPVFNVQGRKLCLCIDMSVSKYFDIDKFHIYLEEIKNCKILQTFEVKGSIKKVKYIDCFCDRNLDFPLPGSRELLGSVYRIKVMNACNWYASICKEERDTMKLQFKFSKGRKTKKNSNLKAQTESEDRTSKSQDKMSDFSQETNISDEEIGDLQEMRNILKETNEIMAQMRRCVEEVVIIKKQELSGEDLEELDDYEENPSPLLEPYSVLHDIAEISLKFQSQAFSNIEKVLMTTQCMKLSNISTAAAESSETGDIVGSILESFQNFICQKEISDLSENDIPLLYEFALKYNLPVLVEICATYKDKHLMSHENLSKLLELALKYDDEKLKEDIISNDCTDGKFLQSEHWLKIAKGNPKIACMAYKNLVDSYSAMFKM